MLLQILRSSLFPGKPSTPGQVSCFPAPLLTLLCFLRQALRFAQGMLRTGKGGKGRESRAYACNMYVILYVYVVMRRAHLGSKQPLSGSIPRGRGGAFLDRSFQIDCSKMLAWHVLFR